jgi:membrane-associated phospholipid phosphatase
MKKTNFIHSIMRDTTAFGGIVFFGFVIMLSIAFGENQLLISLFFGLFFSLAVTVLIRLFYFKNRPNKQIYKNIIERMDASSFPSWHSARAVFLCLLFIDFFRKDSLSVFFVVFAALVLYSRIYLRKHDWLDVMGGVVLGVGTYLITLLL